MSRTKQFLMEKIENDELVFNDATGVYEPNFDNPKVALAFAEAEFESSLVALRNALDRLDKDMEARDEASQTISNAIKQLVRMVA